MEKHQPTTERSEENSQVPAGCRVVVVDGADAGATYKLTTGHAIIGSDPSCHLKLSDRTVSSQHLEVRLTAAGIEVEDLGSTNGSKFLGTRIQRAVVHPGAVFALGRTKVLFDDLNNSAYNAAQNQAEPHRDRIPSRPPQGAALEDDQPTSEIDLRTPFPDAKKRLLDAFESSYLSSQLEKSGHNLAAAARASGLDRSYFKRLLRRHKLIPPARRSSSSTEPPST